VDKGSQRIVPKNDALLDQETRFLLLFWLETGWLRRRQIPMLMRLLWQELLTAWLKALVALFPASGVA
jgi:hypothetical protein